jgi:hypothetical protein
MIPKGLRNRLDLLSNVTNILETQNIKDAESNLDREMTKMKLNDSLPTQTARQNQIMPLNLPDGGMVDDSKSARLKTDEIYDNTRLHTSDLIGGGMNGSTINQLSIHHKADDESIGHHNSNLTLGMQNTGRMVSNMQSRNKLNKLIREKSTKDRFENIDQSMPSMNQFSLTNNPDMPTQLESRIRHKKINSNLHEDYKDMDIIEESKSQISDNHESSRLHDDRSNEPIMGKILTKFAFD